MVRIPARIALFALALLGWCSPVQAQPVNTLTSASISPLGALVRAEFTFVPSVSRYRIDGNGTPQITLTFFGAVKGPGAALAPGGLGVLKNAEMRSVPGGLAFVFTGSTPLRVQAVPAPRAFVVLLSSEAPSDAGAVLMKSGQQPGGAGDVTVLRLKYAEVTEVAQLLGSNALADPLGAAAGGPTQNNLVGVGTLPSGVIASNPLPGPVSVPPAAARISEGIAIDRRLNAVILTGPASATDPIRRLIEAIDTPVPSVLLEVSIVELTESAARDLGIDFSQNGGPLATVSVVARSGQLAEGQLNLQASVYGAVQRGQGRIIARPRVLVESGTSASILTGDSIPIFTNISYPGSGVNIVQQQVQYVNVGVSLQIAAAVDQDDVVHSRVVSTVSSVTGMVQGVPQVSQRQATTNANVANGSSLVIGGLVQESELTSTSGVPGLSSVPVLGGLFKVRHASKQHTDLYIVITPTLTKKRS